MQEGEASTSGRLFSFGIISDIQYANIPDGFSFAGVPRYYRYSHQGSYDLTPAYSSGQSLHILLHMHCNIVVLFLAK